MVAEKGKKTPSASDQLTMSSKMANTYSSLKICSSLVFGTLVFGGFSQLDGQEAGAAFIFGSSEHPVLSEPNGYELFVSLPLFEWLNLHLSYDRVSQDTEADGEVCIRYAPNLSCWIETVHTESAMGSIKLSFLPSIHLWEILQVGAGGGVSFSSLDATSLGESGRIANLEVPNTGQLGYQALVSLSLTPFPTVPLSLVGSATGLWVDFKACVSYESVYDPFCGTARFNEFSAGLAYHF